jgi:lipid A 4'-phosphatase
MHRHIAELIVMLVIAAAITVPFWVTGLDQRFSGLFYEAANTAHPWHYGDFLLWRFFYKAARFIVAVPLALSIVLIAAGVKPRLRHLRRYGLFMLLAIAIGPGLLVNTVFKDNWGHPRPDSLEVFGGKHHYLPPLAKGPKGDGESFPCGHASAGFAYLVFWFVLRGSHRRLAAAGLAIALVLGGVIGLGRIMQGRHYLSDVLWSGYICYLVCLALYHYPFHLSEKTVRAR